MKNAVLTAVKDLIAQKGLLEKQIQDNEDLVATKTAKYFVKSKLRISNI